jgi:hypothetical protein
MDITVWIAAVPPNYATSVAAIVFWGLVISLILAAIFAVLLVRHFQKMRRSATANQSVPEPEPVYPPLDTTHLLEMPSGAIGGYYGGWVPPVGTFSTRYCHLVVADWDGKVYVGLIVRETMESLRASGFTQGTYYVPLCGPGEYMRGENLVAPSGARYEVYPFWLRAESPEMWQDIERYDMLAQMYDARAARGENFGFAYKRHFKGEDVAVPA